MGAIVFKYRNISLSIDSNLFPYAPLNFVPGKKSKEKKENKGLGEKGQWVTAERAFSRDLNVTGY